MPPGPAGQKIARTQLDEVWTRYPALMPKVDTLKANAAAEAKKAFGRINALFRTSDTPIHTRVVLYVGQFDGNAYTVAPMGKQLATVMLPVETPHLRMILAHELTHSVNMQLAQVKNGFGASVGETI